MAKHQPIQHSQTLKVSVIQKQCEYRFTLARRAPIETMLPNKLRCLSDKDIAKSIIEGTYKIPTDLDEATQLILEEIGNM